MSEPEDEAMEPQRFAQPTHPTEASSQAGKPSSSVSSVEETLEVRWIRPGTLTPAMIDWFGTSEGDVERREDVYLVGRHVRGMSVKIRGGSQLDLKVARGIQGILDVQGRAAGEMESWQKWAFPLPSRPAGDVESPEWIIVRKVRHIRVLYVDGVPSGHSTGSCSVVPVSSRTCPWTTSHGRWVSGDRSAGRWRNVDAAVAASVFGDRIPDAEARRPVRCPTWTGSASVSDEARHA
jgi:hypothetical protein